MKTSSQSLRFILAAFLFIFDCLCLHGEEGIPNAWHLCGPFLAQKDNVGGELIRAISLVAEGRTKHTGESWKVAPFDISKPVDCRRIVNHSIEADDVNIYEFAAYSEAYCAEECEESLLVGNDGHFKLFINDTLVDSSAQSRDSDNPSFLVRLKLKKGKNRFLIRSSNKGGRCAFILKKVSSAEDGLRIVLKNASFILKNIVVDNRLNDFNFPSFLGVKCRIDVFDHNRTLVSTGLGVDICEPITIPKDANDGLYFVRVYLNNYSREEPFFVGSPTAFFQRLLESMDQASVPAHARPSVEVNCRRVEILSNAKNLRVDERNWQAKIVSSIADVCTAMASTKKIDNKFVLYSGLHLAAFKSNIDNSNKAYRYYMPHSVEGGSEKFPLIVITPPAVFPIRAFEESNIIASHMDAINFSRLAEFYRVAILWTGYRVAPPSSPPCQIYHFDEAVNSMIGDGRIDRSRMVLLGTCAGGPAAADLLCRSQQRFAGCIFHDAVMHSINSRELSRIFKLFPDYNIARIASDPFKVIQRRPGPPILIAHSGRPEEGHGELEESLTFWEEARAHGLSNIDFLKLSSSYGRSNEWAAVFEWVLKNSPLSNSGDSESSFYPEVLRRTPASNIFGAKFILVLPSRGSDAEAFAAEKFAQDFSANWQEANFSACLVKRDVDLTASDLEESNLVLVGSPKGNTAWKSLMPRFLLGTSKGGYDFINHDCDSEYVFFASASDSKIPHRRIGLVGLSVNAEVSLMSDFNFWSGGWFDYCVWSSGGPSSVIEAGFFDK